MDDWIIKYWVETLFTSVTSGLLVLIKCLNSKHKKQIEIQKKLDEDRKKEEQIKEQTREQEMLTLKLGVQALLRNEIQRAFYECVKKTYCTIDDIDNIENMYAQYHALGGNGPITRLIEKIRQVEVRKEGDLFDQI